MSVKKFKDQPSLSKKLLEVKAVKDVTDLIVNKLKKRISIFENGLFSKMFKNKGYFAANIFVAVGLNSSRTVVSTTNVNPSASNQPTMSTTPASSSSSSMHTTPSTSSNTNTGVPQTTYTNRHPISWSASPELLSRPLKQYILIQSSQQNPQNTFLQGSSQGNSGSIQQAPNSTCVLSNISSIQPFIQNTMLEIQKILRKNELLSLKHIALWMDVFECMMFDNIIHIGYECIENPGDDDIYMCMSQTNASTSKEELKYTPICSGDSSDSDEIKIKKLKLHFMERDLKVKEIDLVKKFKNAWNGLKQHYGLSKETKQTFHVIFDKIVPENMWVLMSGLDASNEELKFGNFKLKRD